MLDYLYLILLLFPVVRFVVWLLAEFVFSAVLAAIDSLIWGKSASDDRRSPYVEPRNFG